MNRPNVFTVFPFYQELIFPFCSLTFTLNQVLLRNDRLPLYDDKELARAPDFIRAVIISLLLNRVSGLDLQLLAAGLSIATLN
jgi:hypothetical protein